MPTGYELSIVKAVRDRAVFTTAGAWIHAPSANDDRRESRGNSDGYNSEPCPRYHLCV